MKKTLLYHDKSNLETEIKQIICLHNCVFFKFYSNALINMNWAQNIKNGVVKHHERTFHKEIEYLTLQ